MNTTQFGAVLRQLQNTATSHQSSDSILLGNFANGDQAAFVSLVERYSALVWGVCRRVLPDRHECEDVFQATFLVLSLKAKLLHGKQSLANWLYTVAVRLALKAKER